MGGAGKHRVELAVGSGGCRRVLGCLFVEEVRHWLCLCGPFVNPVCPNHAAPLDPSPPIAACRPSPSCRPQQRML